MLAHGNAVIKLCSSSLAVPIIVIVAMQCDIIFGLGGQKILLSIRTIV